jgi:hypothetical protein
MTLFLKFHLRETPNGFGTAGYVAVDVNNGLIVLAFRGSDPRSTKSFPTNQQAATSAPVPFPLTNCPNCAVTDGYLPAFQVVNKTGLAGIDVIGTVMNLTVAYPTFQVVVAGHSLGGKISPVRSTCPSKCLSQVLHESPRLNYSLSCYSFGGK